MKLLAFVVFVLIHLASVAQSAVPKWRISTNPMQYYFTGANIAVERVRPKFILGADLSYKPSFCDGCEVYGGIGLVGNYEHQNLWNDNYQSLSFSLYPKFLFSTGVYVSPQPFIRYWWFNQKHVEFRNVEAYHFTGLRNEQQKIVGLRLLIGAVEWKKEIKNMTLFIDASGGPGAFVSWQEFETFNGYVWDQYYPYLKEHRKGAGLSAHFRLQIGFEFE